MSPFVRQIGVSILILLAAAIIAWLSKFLLTQYTKRLSHRNNTKLDDTIIRAAKFPLQAAIMLTGLDLALQQLNIFSADEATARNRLFFAGYYFILYLFLYRLIGGLVIWYGHEVAHRTDTDLDDRFLNLFQRIAVLVLTLIIIIIILERFGVEISALVATLGLSSLAIALAAKDTLGNMFAGFTIMIDQPFKVDDRIEILDIDTWGDVVEIGLRSTRILTRDNRMVTVPNGIIGNGLVVNYSDPSTKYRVETHVGIAYGTEIEEARQLMIEAIRVQDWVMKEERIEALFLTFGDSALVFRVRCWIEHYVETRRIIDKMNTALYHALNEASIDIPFPQRDIHLISSVTPESKIG